MILITPFRRNVLVTRHQAQPADYEDYTWLLKYGSQDQWYERPNRSTLHSIRRNLAVHCHTELLNPFINARPVSMENPKVWASSALVTPKDDDVYSCAAGHTFEGSYSRVCNTCTGEHLQALDATPLVYYMVLSTFQANIYETHFPGKQIYKLVRCGSREAAVAEAFHAAGVNGWNVAFTCVMQLGEDFDKKLGPVAKVEQLWQLASEAPESNEDLRVFY